MRRSTPIYLPLLVLLLSIACNFPGFSDLSEGGNSVRPTVPVGGEVSITPLAAEEAIPEKYDPEVTGYGMIRKLPELSFLRTQKAEGDKGQFCFLSQDKGFACLENDRWLIFQEENQQIESNYVYGLDHCPEGDLLYSVYGKLIVQAGQATQEFIIPDAIISTADAVACAGKDDYWFISYGGVGHFYKGFWEFYPVEQLVTGKLEYNLVEDIQIGENGDVWVMLPNQLVVYRDGRWISYEEGNGFDERPFLDAFQVTTDGQIWLADSSKLYHFQEDEWTEIEYPEFGFVKDMAVDSSGGIWLVGMDTIWTYRNESWTIYQFEFDNSFPAISRSFNAIQFDDSGWLWLATDFGIAAWDGERWLSLHTYSSQIVDNWIIDMSYYGAIDQFVESKIKPTSEVIGTIVNPDGSPIDSQRIQICGESFSYRILNLSQHETPCENQVYWKQVVTDEKGDFIFHEVFEGFYFVAVEYEPGMWTEYRSEGLSGSRIKIKSGQTLDLGKLVIDPD